MISNVPQQHSSPPSETLTRQFEALKQSNFSGRLEVRARSGDWNFYFYLGRLLFAAGGDQPLRRWQRQFAQHCPDTAATLLSWMVGTSRGTRPLEGILSPSRHEYADAQYEMLCGLFKRSTINREQVGLVLQGVVDEVLWDVFQAGECTYQVEPEAQGEMMLTLMSVPETLERVQRSWARWRTMGFTRLSPNSAPLLRDSMRLRERTSAAVFQNLQALLTGQQTLRDLTQQVQLDLHTLTRSLWPYIEENIIQLVEVLDLPPTAPLPTPSSVPLVACVDDSLQICQTMERIVNGAGYRFFAVQEPLRGFATLLQRKPDLIFLDLIMPNTNGYEVCSKLRRVAAFRRTPIIILTGNDGIIDRVRAKFVGSSGFIGKPAKPELVLAVVHRHLAKVKSR
ncbi:response regulator [Candidatus Cyanaurora vandensis]|uniref:response regulator n=1 Tax=Candidatus Cyanaurora vandensis TaxID=2714958 RepID=UPI00257D1059|nr:response regulator [Candidatus Cyanaurora vandensis]